MSPLGKDKIFKWHSTILSTFPSCLIRLYYTEIISSVNKRSRTSSFGFSVLLPVDKIILYLLLLWKFRKTKNLLIATYVIVLSQIKRALFLTILTIWLYQFSNYKYIYFRTRNKLNTDLGRSSVARKLQCLFINLYTGINISADFVQQNIYI